MKRGIAILLLIVINVISVNAQNFSAFDEINLNLNISSSLKIIPTSNNYDISQINVNLFLYPEDNWQQNVLDLKTEPNASLNDGSILFQWQNPEEQKIDFQVTANVKVKNKVFPIRDKISFPIKNLPDELKVWTRPTEKINSDDSRIIRLASDLAEGEDDLFKVVFKLANFTKNYIRYDLAFAGEVKSALWILNNRNGVCGDFSSLFMALTRALGIPIKYVVGVAYTDFEDANEFVPHAWTEVYFPNEGWIPFDPTYGEFGYIDISHVKLKESVDVDNPSVHYEWRGKNFDIAIDKLEFKGQITSETGIYVKPISIETSVESKIVDIGSYQLITAIIKNLKDYYITDQINLFVPSEIKLINPAVQVLYLEPGQEKTLYWIVQVDEILSPKYTYTFPYTIKTLRDISATYQFESVPGSESYTLLELQNKISQIDEEKEKVYSSNVELICITAQDEIYTFESLEVNCKMTNVGNQYLENLHVCLSRDCNFLDLGIGQEKETKFKTVFNESRSSIEIIAKNNLITKVEILDIKIILPPIMRIKDIEYPLELNFNEKYKLSFKLSKEKLSDAQDIFIHYNHKVYPVNDFSLEKEIMINNLKAYDLVEGDNNLKIFIEYKDKRGNKYTISEAVTLKLNHLNIWQKIVSKVNYYLNLLSSAVENAYISPIYK